MRTLRFIGMAIVAVIMSVNFAACSDDDDEDNNGNNPLVGTWIDSYGEGDYFIWKFNADGTGIEQEYYHGGLESPVSFTYTYDAKTTVLTVTYKEDGDLVPTDIDTYYVTFSGNTMTTRQQEPGYTLTAEGATATIKNGDDVIELAPNDEIAKGTPVTLTAHDGDGLEFAGWTVTVNGVVLHDPRDLLTFPNEEDQTTATFDMPEGDVKVRAEYNSVDPVEPPVDPVNPVDPVDPVLPGVIIGGAVILGAYETGTGIYRLMNMQGLPLPSNRIELAELVWERAGKPEPQNMTDEDLYADIDAADTDAQKAAHWMVEQELMKFDEDNNKFHPCFPVSKLRVCLTWQNAKDKGLID